MKFVGSCLLPRCDEPLLPGSILVMCRCVRVTICCGAVLLKVRHACVCVCVCVRLTDARVFLAPVRIPAVTVVVHDEVAALVRVRADSTEQVDEESLHVTLVVAVYMRGKHSKDLMGLKCIVLSTGELPVIRRFCDYILDLKRNFLHQMRRVTTGVQHAENFINLRK